MSIEAATWRTPRWRFVLALSAALTIHIGLLLVVREALRWRPSFDSRVATPMQLRLIDVELVSPQPPPAPELAVASAPIAPPVDQPKPAVTPSATGKADGDRSLPAPEAAGTAAPAVTSVPSASAGASRTDIPAELPVIATDRRASSAAPAAPLQRERQPRLVTPDGRVYLPEVDVAVAAAAARFPVKPAVRAAGSSNPLSHRSPLPYVATRFDRLWVPDGEMLLDTLLRKLSDKLVKKSSSEIAGVQVDCVWILVVAGCTWGTPPRISIDELKKMRADVPMPRGPRTQPGG